jgi:hypothetical protein
MAGSVSITPGPPATISDAKWEERAEELSFDALPNVRATAEKWAGTIATVLAIFGIVTLVKGPQDVTKVEGSFWLAANETWTIVLLGIAVACAVLATLLAASAAYGQPADFRFVGEEVRRLYREEARSAASKLRTSRRLAVAAVIFLAVAVGVTWLNTPQQPATLSKTLVVDKTGIRACGDLQAGRGGGVIDILEKGKMAPTPVPAASIVSVTAVASCPAG